MNAIGAREFAPFDCVEWNRRRIPNSPDGRSADIVLDPFGGAANAAMLRTLALRGRIVIIGSGSR